MLIFFIFSIFCSLLFLFQGTHISSLSPVNFCIQYFCLYLRAKRSILIIAIIGLIAIIAVIHDCISFTVVPDDDLVEEPFEEPCDEPSGTRTPPTPDVSPSLAR